MPTPVRRCSATRRSFAAIFIEAKPSGLRQNETGLLLLNIQLSTRLLGKEKPVRCGSAADVFAVSLGKKKHCEKRMNLDTRFLQIHIFSAPP